MSDDRLMSALLNRKNHLDKLFVQLGSFDGLDSTKVEVAFNMMSVEVAIDMLNRKIELIDMAAQLQKLGLDPTEVNAELAKVEVDLVKAKVEETINSWDTD